MSGLLKKAQELASRDFEEIPVIDLADATSTEHSKRHVIAMRIQEACLSAGFFYIKNHGVPEDVVEDTFRQAEAFFSAPPAVKKSVDMAKSSGFRGWSGLFTENNNPENEGELHEGFNLGLDMAVAESLPSLHKVKERMQERPKDGPLENLAHGDNLWPDAGLWDGATNFKERVLRYYIEMIGLGQRIFPLLALALEMEESFFDDKTQYPVAIQRLLHYPPLKGEKVNEKQPGIGEHTDWECFTILRQDPVAGLQVKKITGEWIDAPYIPGTFLINIGDQLARWTNDVFRSTPHRVNPPPAYTARYSIPTFWSCDLDVPLTPIKSCVSEERPQKYEVITAGAYGKSIMDAIYMVGPGVEA